MWSHHGNKIKQITGVDSPQSFIDNPEAQEKYHKHNLETVVIPKAEEYKKAYGGQGSTEMFMGLIHFLGSGGAKIYLDALKATGDNDKAQAAVDADIYRRTNGKPPKNMKVIDYLNRLNNNL